MSATRRLQALGQSLWIDNITRELLTSGALSGYIRDLSVTGLTSNPTIFQHAVAGTHLYDDAIREQAPAGTPAELLFFEVALEDLRRAADLFRPIHDATGGTDGWVSLEVSPLLADDAAATFKAAADLHQRAARPNLYIKIPGTPAGLTAIEETIFAGIPVNVTLLFSREQYGAAAAAYLSGVERRIAAGRDPKVASVASIFVSRWDVAVQDRVPAPLRNRLGIAIAARTYVAYRELLAAPRFQKAAAAGAIPQRLLWASTGVKDPTARDVLYAEALAAPDTIDTMPDKTLLAFADHGRVGAPMAIDGGDAEEVLAEFARHGIDDQKLAVALQRDGVAAFSASWRELLAVIAAKSAALVAARPA